MVCSGDEYQYCGAGNRLELYRRAGSGVTSSIQAETATTVSFSTSPSVVPFSTTSSYILSSTINASPTPTIVGNFTFQGCITEGSGVRALSQAGLADPQLDLERCAEFCSNYKYFGTEYAYECYCADSLDPSSSEADPSECNMPCSGDASQLCGGPNRLSLYASLREAPPAPRHPEAVGNYRFVGCRTDNAGGTRALADGVFADDDAMTAARCAVLCDGHAFFGTEYGAECYCGNEIARASEMVEEGECGMRCKGDRSEFCGGPNRLSVYALAA